jgi:hypothetical protein
MGQCIACIVSFDLEAKTENHTVLVHVFLEKKIALDVGILIPYYNKKFCNVLC